MTAENQNIDEILVELHTARERIIELEELKTAYERDEQCLRKLSRDLSERVKELNCLYEIARLRGNADILIDDLLQKIIDLIPKAWNNPETTFARLTLGDRELRTQGFRETRWKQTCRIKVNGFENGELGVHCLGEPSSAEDPFLPEERSLLETIAKNIEEIIAHNYAEKQNRIQEQQLIQLDKLAAMGTLVSGVAHEINNPNNFVMLNTPLLEEIFQSALPILDAYYDQYGDFLLGGLKYSEMRDKVPMLFAGIEEGAKRIKGIVDSLKDFVRMEAPDHKQPVDINVVTRSALKLIDNLVKKSTRKLSVDMQEDLPEITGSFQRLEQVIVNLLQNACEALPNREKGIGVSTRYCPENRSVVLTVVDEGVGISKDALPRIIDPFFTTKRKMGGTGLGLSVSSGIVKDHGGTLKFESNPGSGTKAVVTLPVGFDEKKGSRP